jgi:hypothetical protein
MGRGPTVFDVLVSEKNPAADAALLAALRGADHATAHSIVETVLVRNTRPGLRGLVEGFHLLDESLREQLMGEIDRLFGVLREVAQSRKPQNRLNVMAIIRRGCLYRAAYLADFALRDPTPQVRDAAAMTLRHLAERLLRYTRPNIDEEAGVAVTLSEDEESERTRELSHQLENHVEDRRQVLSAIEAGILAFDLHRHPAVLEAAMWFADELGSRLWTTLAPGSRMATAAMSMLESPPTPRLVPFLMTAIGFSEFRPHVAHILATNTDSQFLTAWLQGSWRIAMPRVARPMQAMKRIACTQNHSITLRELPTDAQRHIVRWIASTGLEVDEKVSVYEQIYRHGDSKARREAVWATTRTKGETATSFLRTVTYEDPGELGAIAKRELAIRRPNEFTLEEILGDTQRIFQGNGSCDATAEPVTFERYWSAFDRLNDPDRMHYGRQMLSRTPLFNAMLEPRLQARDPRDRVRAIRIASMLGVCQDFEDRFYELSREEHSEVRSAAISALGTLRTPLSKRILQTALVDPNDRVQANAVEAVESAGGRDVKAELMPKLASSNNRVRANAVKALLKLGVREAAETLIQMLQHEDRMHQISALWLIDKMNLFTLAGRVMELAEDDDDPQIRERAQQLIERLEEQSSADAETDKAFQAPPKSVTESVETRQPEAVRST